MVTLTQLQKYDAIGQLRSAEFPSRSAFRHPFRRIVSDFGYVYSHSTPIRRLDNTRELHHTFRHGKHTVALFGNTGDRPWNTSTGAGSGRMWAGKGEAELRAHLKTKARRYGLARL